MGGVALYVAWMLSGSNTAYGYITAFVAAMIGGQFIQRALFSRKKRYKKRRKERYR